MTYDREDFDKQINTTGCYIPKSSRFSAFDKNQGIVEREMDTVVNNDPDNWRNEANGPYVPMTEEFLIVARGPKHTTFHIGTDVYTLPKYIPIKEIGDWTQDEIRNMHNALDNWKAGVIDVETLRRIAINPEMYTSMGKLIPEVKKKSRSGLDLQKAQAERESMPLNDRQDITNQLHLPNQGALNELQRWVMDYYCGFVKPEYLRERVFPLMDPQLNLAQMDELLSKIIKYFTQGAEEQKAASKKKDSIKPSHYKGLEIIDLVEQLNFNRGSAVNLIAEAGFKNEEVQDLEKALWYVNRELTRIEDIGDSYSHTADATALIEQMNYLRGNAVACICHAGTHDATSVKGDLQKALWYLDHEITRIKKLEEK